MSSFTTKYCPSQAVRNVVETLTQSELIQIDNQRDLVFETPPPDVVSSISQYFETAVSRGSAESSHSDSECLFLTQSVTPVVRTVRRHQSSERAALPLGVESEDDGDHNQENPAHQQECQDTFPRGDSDSENSDDNLASKTRTSSALRVLRAGGSRRRLGLRRPAPPRPVRTAFPFLQKSRLSVHKNHILLNSEIGGFFKCIKKINKGHQERRRELCTSLFLFLVEEDGMDPDDEDDQDDIRKVDAECFVSNAHSRNRKTWLPTERQKMKLASKKHNRESNTDHEERTGEKKERRKTKQKQNKDLEKSREQTKRYKICATSATSSSLSPLGSANISSILTAQEEDNERQPDVLVTCTQSQSLNWHCGGDDPVQQVTKGCENLEAVEPESETVVEETQRPDSEEEAAEGHASETLDDGLRDRDEEFGLEREGWMSSQDLFAQQENQADEMVSSPLKGEVRVRESNEDLESCAMQNNDISLLGKKRQRPPDMSLDEVDRSLVVNAELLRSSQSHVPKLGKIIKLAKKEKRKKKTTDGNVTLTSPKENVHHPPPAGVNPAVHPVLADDPSGYKGNADSGSCQDIVTGIQETVDSPLFNYGGLSFLKKKKRKKIEASLVSSSSTLQQPNTDQDKIFTSQADDSGLETVQKKRKNLMDKDNEDEMTINCALLVEAGGTLPVSVDSPQLLDIAQDPEAHTTKVSELKAKKKRKKKRNVQSLPPEGEGSCVEEGICTTQMAHQAPELLVSMADGHKELRVTDLSSPSRNSEVGSEHSSQRVQEEIIANVFPFGDFKPQRKKKAKKSHLRSEICDGELETGHHTGTNTTEKKMQGSYLEASGVGKQDGERTAVKCRSEIPPGSLNDSEVAGFIEHPANCVFQKADDLVTPRKKKKEKKVVRNVEASQLEATEQLEIPDEIQDSEQHATDVVPGTKVKKKKKKHRLTSQDTEEGAMETPCATSDNMNPSGHGVETHVIQRSNSPEIHEEGGYIPGHFGGSTPLKKKKKKKKKKKRKAMENGFSLPSDGMDTVENNQVDLCLDSSKHRPVEKDASMTGNKPRRREENTAVCLKAGSEPESARSDNDSKGGKRTAALCSDSGGSQSVPQTEGLHEPEREKKKKKKKRRSEADGNSGGDGAENVSCQRSLEGSLLPTSETMPEKKRKKGRRWDGTDSDQNTHPVPAEEVKMVENPREVSVTLPEKEQQKEGSVATTSGELLQNFEEKKKKKKKKEQVVEEIVEAGQAEATEQYNIPGDIQDSEQHATEVVPDTKVKKKKKKHRLTSQDTEEGAMETPCATSDNMNPSGHGVETHVIQQSNSPEIHEEGGYSPDHFGGSTPLKKKKKKRKAMENGFSLPSDGMDTVENNQVDLCLDSSGHRPVEKDASMTGNKPRRREENTAVCLKAGSEPESARSDNDSKGGKRTAALCSDSGGSQSVPQTEGLHEPEREKKKKRKKRRSEADGNVGSDWCVAEHVRGQQSLEGSLLTTPEATPQKERKKGSRWD